MATKDQPEYGPQNPHPLSTLSTELVWEGKYDEYGSRRDVDVGGLVMPMQRIETIDEPRARAEAQGDLFDSSKAHLDDFRNRLIWGDNKLIAASLLAEFRGKVNLICIDPPFDVGADFTMKLAVGDEKKATLEKEQSALEVVAYRDTWGRGIESYLSMMYSAIVVMRDLLADDGCIYVHSDWHIGHYLKLILDDVFGKSNFLNEVVRCYYGGGQSKEFYPRKHDPVFLYRKGERWTFNADDIRVPYDSKYEATVFSGEGTRAPGKTYKPHEEGKVPEDWGIFVRPYGVEIVGYPTQKPEALLDRLIRASSDPGDLIVDLFCGSGTTGAVAERLGRRWIMADLGRFAIHTSRKRMIELQRDLNAAGEPYRAFDVLNLGRYERQWWQKEHLQGADEEHRRIVLDFFRAERLQNAPSSVLHGRKGTAFCHVDAIDSIFTRVEVKNVAAAAAAAGAKAVYCLSWEFEMDLRLECNRLEKELEIEIKLIQIPREIMEKNRKEPPPFLEVATLTAQPVFHEDSGKRTVDVELTSFLPSLSEVPTTELETLKERAVRSGFDFIDFWAVDFDFRNGEPFHHDWQDYRLHKDRSLKTTSEQRYVYPEPGTYMACVKVVDIFGSDTSITVEVPYA